jgi:hypothetical protein
MFQTPHSVTVRNHRHDEAADMTPPAKQMAVWLATSILISVSATEDCFGEKQEIVPILRPTLFQGYQS